MGTEAMFSRALSRTSRTFAATAVRCSAVAPTATVQRASVALLSKRTFATVSSDSHSDFGPTSKVVPPADINERIQQDIDADDVVVYMKGVPSAPQCGFSNAVVKILESTEVEFAAYNVLEDPALREGIKKFSDWPTIPQVYVKGEFVGGSDILINMYQDGELDEMFVEAGVKAAE